MVLSISSRIIFSVHSKKCMHCHADSQPAVQGMLTAQQHTKGHVGYMCTYTAILEHSLQIIHHHNQLPHYSTYLSTYIKPHQVSLEYTAHLACPPTLGQSVLLIHVTHLLCVSSFLLKMTADSHENSSCQGFSSMHSSYTMFTCGGSMKHSHGQFYKLYYILHVCIHVTNPSIHTVSNKFTYL